MTTEDSSTREHRRARLQALIDQDGGNRRNFARRRGLEVQRVANYLNPERDTFGPRAARGLEKDLGLPTYYFDEGLRTLPQAPHLVEVSSTNPSEPEGVFQVAELVRLYAAATPARKTAILNFARAAEKLSTDEDAGLTKTKAR